jgi:cell division protein FtsW
MSRQWKLAGFSHGGVLLVGLLLSLVGVLMIYSSSAVLGMQKVGDGLYYVKKQLIFLGLGWLGYFIVAQIPFVRLTRLRIAALAVALGSLILVLIPGIGQSAGGAQRWIFLGFGQFQPAELARLLIVFYMAATLVMKADRLDSFNHGFLPLLTVTGMAMLLLLLQPDFGSAMSVFALCLALWFVGRVPMAYLGGLLILMLPAVVFMIFGASYRAQRVMTFLDPWADPQGAGFQVIQSFLAFYHGGWTGVGIGNSQQKLFYLPEAHTDFIFSVIGEELGVVGVVFVVGLFLSLLLMGAKITRAQMSTFGYYLAAGVTLYLCLPALLNMMVTLGMLPTKGLPLPFLSSGGSSLMMSLIALGILQSLHARRDEDPVPA